ncbi:MAG TPA: hypothetical protein VHI52_11445, partial [Verrucomicrobiae bacterium]|nr:hypothetical protein [Verrucomicrobiae bacterium]
MVYLRAAAVLSLVALGILSPSRGECDAPSLSVLGFTPSQSIELSLQGQDATNYDIEVSTNLAAWDLYLTLTPTNGKAIFTHAIDGPQQSLFFRASESGAASIPILGLQTSPFYAAHSIITPEDGGTADILTPDLRHIILTVPPGCIATPQAFTMTLITNIEGLPFAQGAFGAVMLEPEELMLSGAASLEIDLPPGLDTRQVASFAANNDGSTFHLVMDR